MDFEEFRRKEFNLQYIASMRPVFNVKALFTDTTEHYVTPSQPAGYDQVTIRFRTARNNVDVVYLVMKGQKNLMTKVETQDDFDYYVIKNSTYSLEMSIP